VPESEPPSGFALQNLSYALQWWLFAGFAVFFWWRLVRDAHERELERREAESSL
jgi:cytochrome oxidase assembly protein ShyY1